MTRRLHQALPRRLPVHAESFEGRPGTPSVDDNIYIAHGRYYRVVEVYIGVYKALQGNPIDPSKVTTCCLSDAVWLGSTVTYILINKSPSFHYGKWLEREI